MAGPKLSSSSTPAPRRSILVRCIIFTVLAIIVLLGLVFLITWLVVRPKKLVYTVEASSVQGFGLHYNRLNASFDFLLQAHNPNSKVSFYYDSMSVSVSYDDQPIAFETIQPFYQPHHNVTKFKVKPTARSVALQSSVAKDLRLEKSSGGIEMEIRLKAKIRMKVGAWKSMHYTLRVTCSSVDVHLYKPRAYKRKRCDVDI